MAVALKTERRVFLWRMVPRVSPSDALNKPKADGGKVAVTLDEIISLLEAEFTSKRARVFLGPGGRLLEDDDASADEKNQIYIADIRRETKARVVILLINRGDPNLVSPAFINTEDQTVRVEQPLAMEAPGASAHLVIAEQGDKNGHRACFEQMAHVSSSLVMATIDRILNRAIEKNPTYKYEDVMRDKRGRRKILWRDYKPTFESRRMPSDKLIDDLDVAELGGVTLTRRREYFGGVGMKNVIKRQEEKVVIHLKPTSKSGIQQFLSDLIPQAKEDGFEQISFDVAKLPGNATTRPTISITDQDAMEQLYVRAQRLTEFDEILEQCYAKICDAIVAKMISLVNAGAW